ncbi:uncharacterized protein LOC117120449 [Anneissia japonica]|uniref:uncharacterized protein LOC117120449 n=1 Tax=Anneissia japonica TaxID=1529436 RepID=UPI00142577EE|nr:uncharacterized protein LOC117120449 [Anneissia japonica]XP_033121367.1 uncharacterized protein LOC117120449 [Anneissia japonica]
MLQLGFKVKFLQKYLLETQASFISIKDLHNVRQKMKEKGTGGNTDEEMLISEIEKLMEEDPGLNIVVESDGTGTLEFLFLATTDMQRAFQLFPEVLMVDGTYSINKLRMPLYTFVIEDGNGKSQRAAYCFVVNEKRDTLQRMMSRFADVHDVTRIKVVIVDKDLKEIDAIKSVIPNASVQLCKFHVLQIFTREIRKLVVTEELHSRLTLAMKQLVYAPSLEKFLKRMIAVASIAPLEFMAYYRKNWDQSRESWAAYLTNSITNLGNTTNNRIESHNHKIKQLLNRDMTLSSAVSNIMTLHRAGVMTTQHEVFNQQMKVAYRLGDDDQTTAKITDYLIPYAASLVIGELKHARTRLQNIITEECQCTLRATMQLPCCHTFARRITNCDTLFRETDCAQRWNKEYYARCSTVIMKRLKQNKEVSETKKQRKNVKSSMPLDKTEKYKRAMLTFKPMADYLSTLGTNEFQEKLGAVQEVNTLWMSGSNAVISSQEHRHPEKEATAENTHNCSPTSDESDTDDAYLNDNPYPYVSSDEEEGEECSSEEPKNTDQKYSNSTTLVLEECFQDEENSTHQCHVPEPTDTTADNVHDDLTSNLAQSASECGTHNTNVYSSQSASWAGMQNIRLPKTPPARGRSCSKKPKIHKAKKENVFQSRQRFIERKKKVMKKNTTTNTVSALADLKNPSVMLDDKHINIANTILLANFPDMNGLQDPVLGSKLHFNVLRGKFIQILHDGNLHCRCL